MLPITLWPNQILARLCEPVQSVDDEIRTLASDMLETMYAAEGRGLAAPQVARALRLFVMDITWKEGAAEPVVCLNPEITWTSPETASHEEGCLSIPGILARVERPAQIHMRWTGLDGAEREADLGGIEAICAKHELDHLDGIVTLDRVDRDTRAALVAAYSP